MLQYRLIGGTRQRVAGATTMAQVLVASGLRRLCVAHTHQPIAVMPIVAAPI